MKDQLWKDLIRLVLPLGVAFLLLVILFGGLAQGAEAEPGVLPAMISQGQSRSNLLSYQSGVSVCQQAKNLVLNYDFEDGIRCSNHWCYSGANCTFETYTPGHGSSGIAGRIHAGRPVGNVCEFYTPLHEIPVQPGRRYNYLAWVSSDFAQGRGSAFLCVTFCSSQLGPSVCKVIERAYTQSVTDTKSAWVQVTGLVTAPAKAEYALVEAVVDELSEGYVWFDDIFLGLATCMDISKIADPNTVTPGQMLTYTIVYTNTGRENATDVQVIEAYDRYEYFAWAQPAPLTGTNNHWDIADLPPGISDTITVVVEVADDTRDRALLINGVQIRSRETLEKPVYTTLATTVTNGDGCDVALYLPSVEGSGESGDPTDYELVLSKAGSCDGRANLVAVSSQGWVTRIIPSPPYTLTSGHAEEKVTVRLDVPSCEMSGTVDVTWITATLGCTLPCTRTAMVTATVKTTVTQGLVPRVRLPLILRSWPPVPVLSPIDNADIDGGYVVSWSSVGPAASYYILEEATDDVFSSANQIYTGPYTYYAITGQDMGQYHYRVKVCGDGWCGGWSNKEGVGAWWEHEPNDSCPQANGPVTSGMTYAGTFTSTADIKDLFYFDLTAQHSIELWLTNIPTGCDYDLALRDANGNLVDYSNESGHGDEHILVGLRAPGRHYAQAYYYAAGCLQPYHLRVVYR